MSVRRRLEGFWGGRDRLAGVSSVAAADVELQTVVMLDARITAFASESIGSVVAAAVPPPAARGSNEPSPGFSYLYRMRR